MAKGNKGNNKIVDLQSYPILTEEVDSWGARRPGASGASLDQIIEGTLQEILGWRPRIGDPKGFEAALTQSFTLTEEDGHQKWVWTPHTYTIQADLGAVTGAQASIYARARVTLDQSLPLLEGLKSLLPDADPEDTEASKAIVESSLTELVGEMGLVGGPRVQRVDSYFSTLLGSHGTDDPEQVSGQLGLLRERLGLERQQVNTVAEEQNLTNFRILVDYIISLKQSWDSQRRFFNRRPGTDVFLGTHLVLLSRELAVLVESVQEAYFAMDSVFLRDVERQAIQLDLGDDQPTLTIAELLGWVERFASEEGPRLIREAGKDGVISFRSTVEQLHEAVSNALKISKQPSANPGKGFHTPRVQRTLEELTLHLDETLKLVGQLKRLPAPLVTSIVPEQASPLDDQPVSVTVNGENFQDGAKVILRRADDTIESMSVTVVSQKQIDVKFDLTEAAPGAWVVVVTNADPDGQSSSKKPGNGNTFTVEELPPQPTVDTVAPASSQRGKILELTIEGADFHEEAVADLGSDIFVLSTTVETDNRLKVIIGIFSTADPGPRDVAVINPGDQRGQRDRGFTVEDTVDEQEPPRQEG